GGSSSDSFEASRPESSLSFVESTSPEAPMSSVAAPDSLPELFPPSLIAAPPPSDSSRIANSGRSLLQDEIEATTTESGMSQPKLLKMGRGRMGRTLGSVPAPDKPARAECSLFHQRYSSYGGLRLTVRTAGGPVHVSAMVWWLASPMGV